MSLLDEPRAIGSGTCKLTRYDLLRTIKGDGKRSFCQRRIDRQKMTGIIAVALVLCGTWTQATMPSIDGKKHAPVQTAQFPTLLSKYRARPAWNVAGVDYAVGYAAGTALKDPMTGPLPAGVTRYSANHIFQITGNNVVISGWDFFFARRLAG